METITRIKDISLSKLNNAEFTYFAGQVINFINTGTAAALHIEESTFQSFTANQQRLVELVDQSHVADETALIAETDKQEDDLLSYLFTTFKNGCSHPIESKRNAAQALYNVTKPYFGVQSKPQRQEVQIVEGMLTDLEKEANAAHMATLGLDAEMTTLKELNTRYKTLLEERASSQAANPVEAAKPIRETMYAQYEEMTTLAWAFSVSSPSDALTSFITNLNKLVDDTNTAYNQRMAQRKKSNDNGE